MTFKLFQKKNQRQHQKIEMKKLKSFFIYFIELIYIFQKKKNCKKVFCLI